jgi:hypothetical protein
MIQCPDCMGKGHVCSECGAPCEEGHVCETCSSDAAKTCPFCKGTGAMEDPGDDSDS